MIESGRYDCNSALRALADGKIDHHVWNRLHKKELWDNIRFPDGHVFEDIDTTFKIFNLCNTVFVVNETLYYYRKRAGSITSLVTYNNLWDRILAYSHFELFVEDKLQEVFSINHLMNIRNIVLKDLIVYYCLASKTDLDIKQQDLRARIINLGKKTEIKKIGLKGAFCTICNCPLFLKIVYLMYYKVFINSFSMSQIINMNLPI